MMVHNVDYGYLRDAPTELCSYKSCGGVAYGWMKRLHRFGEVQTPLCPHHFATLLTSRLQ